MPCSMARAGVGGGSVGTLGQGFVEEGKEVSSTV